MTKWKNERKNDAAAELFYVLTRVDLLRVVLLRYWPSGLFHAPPPIHVNIKKQHRTPVCSKPKIDQVDKNMLLAFCSIRNKKNENRNSLKGKDIEKSILTATFVPSSQDNKIDNRIISQVLNDTGQNENSVQVTYRPTTKSK